MTEHKQHVQLISIDGKMVDKPQQQDNQCPKLQVQGETIYLDNFMLVGQSKEGQRVMYTFGCSLDEMSSYVITLQVLVEDKHRDLIGRN